MSETRLNKYLSASGVCSRREADREIEAGHVLVNGQVASMGLKVTEGDEVIFNGKPVGGDGSSAKPEPVLLAVNKPRGIVCTTSDKDRAENIVDFLNYPVRIYPVGRLDKESEGLILMTNQGDLVNEILKARKFHEKEYQVTVDHPITDEFIEKMGSGVKIRLKPDATVNKTAANISADNKTLAYNAVDNSAGEEVTTRPCKIRKTGMCSFRIILTQGLNRQIRRMSEACGYKVLHLKRVRIMNIELGDLKAGKFREVKGQEYEELMRLLVDTEKR